MVAVALREPGFEDVFDKLASPGSAGIGTPTLVETGLVLGARFGREPLGLLSRMLAEFDVTPVPFGDEHWREANRAYWRFGRGRHEAKLNFGDCMAYAVARLACEPLLFVGDDFSKTDLARA